MQLDSQRVKGRRFAGRLHQLKQALLVGLAVAVFMSLVQWAGLFTSLRLSVIDYLYGTAGDLGTGDSADDGVGDVVIVAVDEKSLQSLGEWPWPFAPYSQLFARLEGARVIGFDILLPNAGYEGHPDTLMLLDATRQAGKVVLPLDAFDLFPPAAPGEPYAVRHIVHPFPALSEAAAAAGSVKVVLDRDGTLRRIPLVLDAGTGQMWEAFALQILRLYLDLGDDAARLSAGRVLIGDGAELQYIVPTDENGAMLVNFVGHPNTFPVYSFSDVVEGQVPSSAFEDKIVLVGMMNALTEMDLYRTPVAPQRMSGVEIQANAIHTLLHHRWLVPQRPASTIATIVLLALVSALVLSQLGGGWGAVFTGMSAAAYFIFTGLQFDMGYLPDILLPYGAIFLIYAAVMAARFTRERVEHRRVSDTFGRFVSTEVRDLIVNVALENPDLIQPGGRQMEISVLFADIRGFTTIAESLPPAEVVEVLNQYLDSMEEEVFRQGGTLDKYTGDGIMVIFGAPLEQPDHAERAVRAALGMQQAAAEVSRRQGDVQMAYGIGIATGPAVVGHIGSKRRLDYTAIGDTVNLAARFEGIAPAGTVLINQAAFEAVGEVAVVEPLEPVMVKGKAKPVAVYRVLGLR